MGYHFVIGHAGLFAFSFVCFNYVRFGEILLIYLYAIPRRDSPNKLKTSRLPLPEIKACALASINEFATLSVNLDALRMDSIPGLGSRFTTRSTMDGGRKFSIICLNNSGTDTGPNRLRLYCVREPVISIDNEGGPTRKRNILYRVHFPRRPECQIHSQKQLKNIFSQQ